MPSVTHGIERHYGVLSVAERLIYGTNWLKRHVSLTLSTLYANTCVPRTASILNPLRLSRLSGYHLRRLQRPTALLQTPMSSTLIIDDNDPSVRYDPSWSLAEGPGYGRAYKLTLHSARDAGGSATVAFRGMSSQIPCIAEQIHPRPTIQLTPSRSRNWDPSCHHARTHQPGRVRCDIVLHRRGVHHDCRQRLCPGRTVAVERHGVREARPGVRHPLAQYHEHERDTSVDLLAGLLRG